MRVVLDTNVLVSALLFTGMSAKLVPLWQRSAITVLLSRGILEEYLPVLSYPKCQLAENPLGLKVPLVSTFREFDYFS